MAYRFTSAEKELFEGDAGVMITTYTMIAYSGNRSEESQKVMSAIANREWGLLLLDEVHVVPANMFRKVSNLQLISPRSHPDQRRLHAMRYATATFYTCRMLFLPTGKEYVQHGSLSRYFRKIWSLTEPLKYRSHHWRKRQSAVQWIDGDTSLIDQLDSIGLGF